MRLAPAAIAWALFLAGCPAFEGQFGCDSTGACPDDLICGARGLCCPAPTCEGLCGETANECGAKRSCPCEVLWVDETALPGGVGTEARPLRTITEALELAPSAEARVIQIGPGSYGADESFPLQVRGGLEIRGAGAGLTHIQGAGPWTTAVLFVTHPTTFVIGDSERPTRISDLHVRCLDPASAPIAILCDRGDSDVDTATPPNTRIERVLVDGGCDTSIGVVGSAVDGISSACNLRVTDTRIVGGRHGIFQQGACASTAWPSLEIDRVEVSGIETTDASGNAVYATDCSRRLSIERLHAHDGEAGVDVAQQGPSATPGRWFPVDFRMANSRIENHYGHGLALFYTAQARLVGNRFTGHRGPGYAVAIVLTTTLRDSYADEPFPSISHARGNVIHDNDIGVAFHGVAIDRASDFGRPGDPGGNVFTCNSSPGRGDWMLEPTTTRGVMLEAFGNVWDHEPPTRRAAVPPDSMVLPPAGTDIIAPSDALILIEGGRSSTTTCPADRTAGP